MKILKEREKYDDYEIKDEYDFIHGIRGKFYQPQKKSKILQLDDDVLSFFQQQADKKKINYQMLINNLLRKHMKTAQLGRLG